MPGFDGTGPAGLGPMTGGGRGFCVLPRTTPRQYIPAYRPSIFNLAGWRPNMWTGLAYSRVRPFFGRGGLGRGIGRGRGRGRW